MSFYLSLYYHSIFFQYGRKKIQSISLVFNKIVRFDAEHPDVCYLYIRVFALPTSGC